MTKRDFLIGAAAASGGVMLGRLDASGQTDRRVIDAHTHWYPEQWVELVQNEGEAAGARIGRNDRGSVTFNAGGIGAVFSPNYIDLESRIKSMDETGINAQVLSLMAPMVYWAPPAFGLKLAQTYNDACVAAHRKYPDRFVGLAMLPMQQPGLPSPGEGGSPGLRGHGPRAEDHRSAIFVCPCEADQVMISAYARLMPIHPFRLPIAHAAASKLDNSARDDRLCKK
jgi:Amidohydrolase